MSPLNSGILGAMGAYSPAGQAAAPANPYPVEGAAAGAGMGGGGGWLMPALGIGLKILGMFGGKKAQSVLAGHNAGLAIGGLAGALLGSNNPFLGNQGEDSILGGDKDKNKKNPMSIGGNFMNLPGFGVFNQDKQ